MMDAIDAAESSPQGLSPKSASSVQQLPLGNNYGPASDLSNEAWSNNPSFCEPTMQNQASLIPYEYQQNIPEQFSCTNNSVPFQGFDAGFSTDISLNYQQFPCSVEQYSNCDSFDQNGYIPAQGQDDLFNLISSTDSVLNPESPESGFFSTASYDL